MSDKMESALFSQLKCDFLIGDENTSDYRTFLRSTSEYRLLTSSNVLFKQDTVGLINADLTRRDRRLQGLCLLRHVLEQCSTDVFAENSSHWGPALTKIVSDPAEKDSHVTDLACVVLAKYIQLLATVPEAARGFGQGVLPGFLSAVLDAKIKRRPFSEAVLSVLSHCVQIFPGPCRIYKTKIEQNTAGSLDSHSSAVRAAAGRCLAVSARCTSGGSTGAESWSQVASGLLAGLHAVLDQLYGDIESGFNGHNPSSASTSLHLSAVTSVEPTRTIALLRQYEGVSDAVCSHLGREFTSVVKLPVEDVLKLVTRALAVLPRDLSSPTQENQRLLCVLPFVHVATLGTLKALISAGRHSLIPHADIINDLVLQMLRATSPTKDTVQGGLRSFNELRGATYSVILTWLRELGDSSGLNSLRPCTDLVQEILRDSRPQQRDGVTFELNRKLDGTTSLLGGSSKKRKHNAGASVGGNGVQMMAHDNANADRNSEICTASLQVLRQLLISCDASLPTAQLRVILDFCLPLVVSVQSHIWSTPSSRIPSPYSNARCRLGLYEVLKASSLSSTLQPPICVILKLFSVAQQDSDQNVKMFCAEALRACMSMRHAKRGKLVQEVQSYSYQDRPRERIQNDRDAETEVNSRIVKVMPTNHVNVMPLDAQLHGEGKIAESVQSIHPEERVDNLSANDANYEEEMDQGGDVENDDDDEDDDDDDDETKDDDDEDNGNSVKSQPAMKREDSVKIESTRKDIGSSASVPVPSDQNSSDESEGVSFEQMKASFFNAD